VDAPAIVEEVHFKINENTRKLDRAREETPFVACQP